MSTMPEMGTRPEITKMAPVVRSMEELRTDYIVVHTNQNYDHSLNARACRFLKE